MEFTVPEAKARLPEIIGAAQNGERVVITKRGKPVVEIVRCLRTGGIDFDKLNAACLRLGIEGDAEGWPANFDSPAFSRRALGLE